MSSECYDAECFFHEKEEPFCHLSCCQKCPTCCQLDFIPVDAFLTIMLYGNGEHKVKCVHCSNEVLVTIEKKTSFQLVGIRSV